MRESTPDFFTRKKFNGILRNTWDQLTRPISTDIEKARWEYMTKVVLVFVSLVSFTFLVAATFGWVKGEIPFDTVLILFIMSILFVTAWILTNKGFQKLGGIVPCLILFVAGVYGNLVGGIGAPAMLLYALAIILSVILMGPRTQTIFLVLSLFSIVSIGFLHNFGLLPKARDADMMFVNRIGITIAALTTISLGVWFLKNQYQLSLIEMRTYAQNTRSLIETIVDGIVFSDPNGIIVDVNESAIRIFNINNKEQVIGRNIVEFLIPEDQPLADSLRDTLISGNNTGPVSCTGLLPSGEKISLEINSALYLNASGQSIGFVSTLRDITERKQTEEELAEYREKLEKIVAERTMKLKEAYEELESFSYSISHDLRSPLRAINGYISLISEDPDNSFTEESSQFMTHIKDSAVRMGELITDLLSFSRIIRQPVSRIRIYPKQIAIEVIDDLLNGEYVHQNTDIQVDDMPACKADGILIHQVYYNLIDNALKYSRKQKQTVLRIGAKKGDSGETIYYVSDNGIGFNMKYSEKLFGVFQRLHNDPEYEGTGIGLATVYRIIQRHDGKIWVESYVNKGTTFYFTLDKTPLEKEEYSQDI